MIETILRKIREAQKEPAYQHEDEDWLSGLYIAEEIVEEVADIQPTASWEPPFGDWTNIRVSCSHCRIAVDKHEARWFNYCPYCGKKMIYKEEEQ